MYFSPQVFSALVFSALLMSHSYANDTADLSVLSESELRTQTGDIQYQPDDAKVQAFEHYLIKMEMQPYQFTLIDTARVSQEILPTQLIPNFDLPLPILLHVDSIAEGLRSDNPLQGLYSMIDPVVNPNSPLQQQQMSPIQLNLGQVSIATVEQPMNLDGLTKLFLLSPY